MHQGRVLAEDAPAALVEAHGEKDLEGVFIALLQGEQGDDEAPGDGLNRRSEQDVARSDQAWASFSPRRWWAFARRELQEIFRDPIRLTFAWLGSVILMVVLGYGISLDVENLGYAVLDQDRSSDSRQYLQHFEGSRYFDYRGAVRSPAEARHLLRSGEVTLVIVIPPGMGRDLAKGIGPQIGFWIDGAMPFQGENVVGYVRGVHEHYLEQLALPERQRAAPRIETRFRYNQDFRSIYAMAPGVMAVLLLVIPATLTAVGVVREKELGSIANLYASPATRTEFLLGKQFPYFLLGLVNLALLMLLLAVLFQVPLKGDAAALIAGALIYLAAATAWGLLVSCFTRTQIAAVFAAFILTMLPAINFSGLIKPVSSLEGPAAVFGELFPASHFLSVSVGVYTKALGAADLWPQYLALIAFTLVFLAGSILLLRPQER
jgi:ribosome-dependent ATPase